jgi:hypothetical protein
VPVDGDNRDLIAELRTPEHARTRGRCADHKEQPEPWRHGDQAREAWDDRALGVRELRACGQQISRGLRTPQDGEPGDQSARRRRARLRGTAMTHERDRHDRDRDRHERADHEHERTGARSPTRRRARSRTPQAGRDLGLERRSGGIASADAVSSLGQLAPYDEQQRVAIVHPQATELAHDPRREDRDIVVD